MFGIPLPIIKQTFFWSATVVTETTLGLPLWGWVLICAISGLMLYLDYRKTVDGTTRPPVVRVPPLFTLLSARINPGNDDAIISLIAKARSAKRADRLFSNYINSASHHKAHEIEVVAVHYWKKCQLLEKDEEAFAKWFISGREETPRKYGVTLEQWDKARQDVARKYPELVQGEE